MTGASSTRVQQNFLARRERILLDAICERLPDYVTPNMLTAVGVGGALISVAGYALSNAEVSFLWLACAGLGIQWFGDSLDGSLARYRHIERPRFGYFLDHSLDAICTVLFHIGLGLTAFIRLDTSLFCAAGYLLMSIHVFLRYHATGVFQLSFSALGPTEARIGVIVLTIVMACIEPDQATIVLGEETFSIFDGVMVFAGGSLIVTFITSTVRTLRELSAQEPARMRVAVRMQHAKLGERQIRAIDPGLIAGVSRNSTNADHAQA